MGVAEGAVGHEGVFHAEGAEEEAEAGGQPVYAEATVDGKGGFMATFAMPGEWPAGQTISEPRLMVVATTGDGSAKATAEFTYEASGPPGSATSSSK